MGDVTQIRSGGAIARFEPYKARMVISGLQGAIKQAKSMRDWAMGEQAIDELIAMQMAFVSWWDATIDKAGGDRQTEKALSRNKDNGLAVLDATAQTGISKQHVSRWRERLRDPEVYRVELRKALQTVAMASGAVKSTFG